jgi:hypothetical protein
MSILVTFTVQTLYPAFGLWTVENMDLFFAALTLAPGMLRGGGLFQT